MRTDIDGKASIENKDYYLLVIDDTGKIKFANSFLVSTFELDQKKILESSFFDFLDADQVAALRCSLEKLKTQENKVQIETTARNGSLHWIKWEISCLQPSPGEGMTYLCQGYDITDKIRVKKMRVITQQNYQTIVEGLNTGIILQDSNGQVLAVNKKAAELFDTCIEDIYDETELRKLWSTFENENGSVSFESSPPVKALKTGESESNETFSFTDRSGQTRYLIVNAQPLFEEKSGTPISVVTSFTDATREKMLKKKAQERSVLFRTFMNNTPNLAWIVDEDASLLFANNIFLNFLGLSEKAINQNIMELLPKVIGEALYERHKTVLDTGHALQTQEKMFWANGSELVFWINLFPIEKVDDKRLVGGEAINITDRVKTETQLKSAVDRFTTLSNITNDAIWEWDMRTGIVYRNEKLKDLVGFSNMQDKHGLSWWFRRIHPEDRNRVSDKVNEAAEKGIQSWQDEYRFKCADGHYKYIFDRGFIVYENNVPIKMIGSLHDMTQVKQLEQKLVTEKLQKQKDITETIFSVQEKERTRIGHELHDNVNQILTTSKLFLDMVSTPEKKHDELKKKVSEYILLAIEEIRKLSKEMVTPQLKEDGLVTSITNLVEDLNATSTLHILFHHQDDIEMLSVAKKVTLFRIIQEQVKNVLKYSQAINLTINLHMHNENVELLIEDDGIGFDPNQTSRGIGLSNIYERTRFYNGEVVIDTAPAGDVK
ncbi:MAG: PAS domain S-box protein [Bacteroidia bacterium]|nr:PAS domain S-box protein [Bacteroidia bacterium]